MARGGLVVPRAGMGECDQCGVRMLWGKIPEHYASKHRALFIELWEGPYTSDLINHVARQVVEKGRAASAAAESVAETDVTSAEGSTGGGALSGADIASHGGNTNAIGNNDGGHTDDDGNDGETAVREGPEPEGGSHRFLTDIFAFF